MPQDFKRYVEFRDAASYNQIPEALYFYYAPIFEYRYTITQNGAVHFRSSLEK